MDATLKCEKNRPKINLNLHSSRPKYLLKRIYKLTLLTKLSPFSFRTLADIAIFLIQASSSIATWIRGTLIDVDLALLPLIPWFADTARTTINIHACSPIMANIRCAVVNHLLTSCSY